MRLKSHRLLAKDPNIPKDVPRDHIRDRKGRFGCLDPQVAAPQPVELQIDGVKWRDDRSASSKLEVVCVYTQHTGTTHLCTATRTSELNRVENVQRYFIFL